MRSWLNRARPLPQLVRPHRTSDLRPKLADIQGTPTSPSGHCTGSLCVDPSQWFGFARWSRAPNRSLPASCPDRLACEVVVSDHLIFFRAFRITFLEHGQSLPCGPTPQLDIIRACRLPDTLRRRLRL
jgi:hypothetical protein